MEDDLEGLQDVAPLAVPTGVTDADIVAGAYIRVKYRGEVQVVGAMVLRVEKVAAIDGGTAGFKTTVTYMTDHGSREELKMPDFLKKVVSVVGYAGGFDPSGTESVEVPERPILELQNVSMGLAKLGDRLRSEQAELRRMLGRIDDKLGTVEQRVAYDTAGDDYASLRIALFEALDRRLPNVQSEVRAQLQPACVARAARGACVARAHSQHRLRLARSQEAPAEAVELLQKLHRAMTSDAPAKPPGLMAGDEGRGRRGRSPETPGGSVKKAKGEPPSKVELARAAWDKLAEEAEEQGLEAWQMLDGTNSHQVTTAGAKGTAFRHELHRVRAHHHHLSPRRHRVPSLPARLRARPDRARASRPRQVLKEPKDFYAEWKMACNAKTQKKEKKDKVKTAAIAALRARGHGFVNYLSETNNGMCKVERLLRDGYMAWNEETGKLEKVGE